MELSTLLPLIVIVVGVIVFLAIRVVTKHTWIVVVVALLIAAGLHYGVFNPLFALIDPLVSGLKQSVIESMTKMITEAVNNSIRSFL